MKKTLLLLPFFLILVGCTSKVTEENLIGGTWVATAGFEDGEAKGEPYCNPFEEGLEFKDKETVYVNDLDQDFEYCIEENDGDYIINFYHSHRYRSYYISKISDDEMGITIEGNLQKGASCYLERE